MSLVLHWEIISPQGAGYSPSEEIKQVIEIRNFTKIIATIGPASDTVDAIRALYHEGMSVARLNFSHGNHEYFSRVIENIRKVSEEIAILLDTKGPEIRTGNAEPMELTEGQIIELGRSGLPINYKWLSHVPKGAIIDLADGALELMVCDKHGSRLFAKVTNGGKLQAKAKVAIRDYLPQLPFFSETDKQDLIFGIKSGLDFVAASFVSSADNVMEIRKFLEKHNSSMKIVAKIEHSEAVRNIQEIVAASDAVMVARGDLGIAMPVEKVPKLQADIIQLCRNLRKPVIVATQMLESMREHPHPTRAEVTDVAQAVLQGADAIMLSAETATGKYPAKAVRLMATIAKEYDGLVKGAITDSEQYDKGREIGVFVTHAAFLACNRMKIKAIIAPTDSGSTARNMSILKAHCPIMAFTESMQVVRQLQLCWGVFPSIEKTHFASATGLELRLIERCYKNGVIGRNDNVVFIRSNHSLGIPFTNLIEVIPVKNVIKE